MENSFFLILSAFSLRHSNYTFLCLILSLNSCQILSVVDLSNNITSVQVFCLSLEHSLLWWPLFVIPTNSFVFVLLLSLSSPYLNYWTSAKNVLPERCCLHSSPYALSCLFRPDSGEDSSWYSLNLISSLTSTFSSLTRTWWSLRADRHKCRKTCLRTLLLLQTTSPTWSTSASEPLRPHPRTVSSFVSYVHPPPRTLQCLRAWSRQSTHDHWVCHSRVDMRPVCFHVLNSRLQTEYMFLAIDTNRKSRWTYVISLRSSSVSWLIPALRTSASVIRLRRLYDLQHDVVYRISPVLQLCPERDVGLPVLVTAIHVRRPVFDYLTPEPRTFAYRRLQRSLYANMMLDQR